jgi:hypothetical protein
LQTLTTADVLGTPAEYANELHVRTIGPAIVLVLERDAPIRMEVIAGTHGEMLALQEWVHRDEQAAGMLDSYFAQSESELFSREDRHTERLAQGRSLSTLRVSDHL